jgi:hypothetical protein
MSTMDRRRLLRLAGATATATAAGAVVGTVGTLVRSGAPALAAAGAAAGGVGPVTALSRARNLLDAVVVGADGGVYTAAWRPGDPAFRAWTRLGALELAPISPVGAAAGASDRIDLFAAGLDGLVYAGSWWPDIATFDGWVPVGDLRVASAATVTALALPTGRLDLFAAGLDGVVHTASRPAGDGAFGAWAPVGDLRVPPGAPIAAASPGTGATHLFAVGEDGGVAIASRGPDDSAFGRWTPVAGGQAAPGAPVGVVSRAADRLDVFVVGLDGSVYTASREPGASGFDGWWAVGGVTAPARAPVTAVSRSQNLMDVFVADAGGAVLTAAWAPGDTAFRGWWPVAGGASTPGTAVGAVSRSRNLLDVFVAGTDAAVYTAAWRPGDSGFRGWWGIGDLVTGLPDPMVAQWRQVGDAYGSNNTSYSNEAQGVCTDGGHWYLVSNGSKTLRKIDDRGRLVREVGIPPGAGAGHVGAPGYFDGWVYVPVQHPYGVWRITADLGRSEWHPVDTTDNRLSWCGVNPLNGRLYTSMYDISSGQVATLFAYDRDSLARRPEDDIVLGDGEGHVDRIQGGVFTPRGRFVLVRCDPNAVFCFSTRTGHRYGVKQLGDFGNGSSEVESVAVRPWTIGANRADVQIFELDNDWPDGDDCYLHSFAVPQPGYL